MSANKPRRRGLRAPRCTERRGACATGSKRRHRSPKRAETGPDVDGTFFCQRYSIGDFNSDAKFYVTIPENARGNGDIGDTVSLFDMTEGDPNPDPRNIEESRRGLRSPYALMGVTPQTARYMRPDMRWVRVAHDTLQLDLTPTPQSCDWRTYCPRKKSASGTVCVRYRRGSRP